MTRKKLFISYSHKDVRWFERVREQLAVLEREGLIDPFADTRIDAGDDWYARLDQEMLEVQIALLLISASFLTSAFIRKEEIPKLFGQHEAAGMVLYPLLVRDCPWQEVSWLARLQMRPPSARPIASMGAARLDRCLADVAREIASMVRAGSTAIMTSQSEHAIGAPHEQRTGGPATGQPVRLTLPKDKEKKEDIEIDLRRHEIAKDQILEYLERNHYERMSFEGIRQYIDPTYSDDFLMEVIRHNHTQLRWTKDVLGKGQGVVRK